jgi:hypothetical protein
VRRRKAMRQIILAILMVLLLSGCAIFRAPLLDFPQEGLPAVGDRVNFDYEMIFERFPASHDSNQDWIINWHFSKRDWLVEDIQKLNRAAGYSRYILTKREDEEVHMIIVDMNHLGEMIFAVLRYQGDNGFFYYTYSDQ